MNKPKRFQERNRAHRHAAGTNRRDARKTYERQIALARNAAQAGAPIDAESHYQRAEHFWRLLHDGSA